MAHRRVTKSGKDSDGDITALCNGFGRVSKAAAISHIEHATHSYYVQDSLGRTAEVEVYTRLGVKHLRTDPDSSCSNNLDNIPDC